MRLSVSMGLAALSLWSVIRTRVAAAAEARLDATAELGGLSPLYHRLQFGRDGTSFDYVKDGGQDVIFPFGRLSMDLVMGRHHVVFLYQPLELDTQVVVPRAVTVDGLTFPAGTPLDLRYGFPFYRLSYLYQVSSRPGLSIQLGGSLQIRNATITFSSADGQTRRANRDVGPVPAFKTRIEYTAATGWFTGLEIDGFYAPVKYLNGGKSDVTGAIVDASVRGGYHFSPAVAGFLNVRWLGGGAEGTSEPEDFSDGYTRNWLHFLIVSLGVRVVLR
jgi:hypothetical protein